MTKSFIQLSSRQIDLAKEPNGKSQASSNYTDLFNGSEARFSYLEEISRLFPYFEDNSKGYPNTAGKIRTLFTEEYFKPILENVFSVQCQGASLDDLLEFDTKRINGEKIILAKYLLHLSTSYLFRTSSFLNDIYPESLVKQAISTIRLMASAVEKYKKMEEELKEYKRREALEKIKKTEN